MARPPTHALRSLCGMLLLQAGCQTAAAQKENRLVPEPAPEVRGLGVRSGELVSLHEQRGNVVLLSFGYSSCADICPLTLATIGKVLSRLRDDARSVRVLYVTVDPARDSAEHLREFLDDFDARIEGLVIADRDLRDVLRRYRVVATHRAPNLRRLTRADVDPERDYSIDHTPSLWAIDRRGRMRIRYDHDADADQMVAGVRELLRE